MRYYYLLLTVCILISSALFAATDSTSGKQKQTIEFEDQDDTTDIFAIPLDDSEEEDEQEMQELEEIGEKQAAKKAADSASKK